MPSPAPLRVSKLAVTNFQRITSLDIQPGTKTLVVLYGPNESGKTSTIDSLIATLMGKRYCPTVPITTGEKESIVEVTLSDDLADRYKVIRSWSGNKTYLHVYQIGDDGQQAKVTGAQGFLSSLVADVAFDPLAFSRAGDADQTRMLLTAIGHASDYEALQERRQVAYESRRNANAAVKATEADLSANPDPDPENVLEPISDEQSKAEMAKAEAANNQRRGIESAITAIDRSIEICTSSIDECTRQIAELEQRKAALGEQINAHRGKRIEFVNKLEASPEIDAERIAAYIAKVTAHNNRVEQQQAHHRKATLLASRKADVEAINEQIAKIDAEVAELLASGDIANAVPGLAIIDGSLHHNGVPFSQASGMRKLELSCLVGMAAHPRLRIMAIDEGDRLDDQSLTRLIELAKERRFAVWMTAVRRSDETDPDTYLVPVADGKVGFPSPAEPSATPLGDEGEIDL